jgi:type 1 glutamine amidotransferase
MPNIRLLFITFVVPAFLLTSAAPAADPPQETQSKIRVLVVTGGHGFETNRFFKVFKDNPDITFQAVGHPQVYEMLKPGAAHQYDVIVTYDYGQKIPDAAKQDFVARLTEGKGLVALHHAIAAYPQWPEYWNIIGARYYLAATNLNGVAKPRSAYKHDVDFKIYVADPQHPVTQGVKDFEIHDETYKWFDVFEECHPLLTTDEPESNKVIGWAKTYKGARVVFMQSGHDHLAFENPNFQQILRQAIRWTARKD